MLTRFKVFFLVLGMLFFSNVEAFEDHLKTQDISKVMRQIFEQHLDQKDVSAKLIRSAFKAYIDQFDPQRIYLLEADVAPYLNLSDERTNAIINQYRAGSFESFDQLNTVIQKSIIRARAIRGKMEHMPSELFDGKALTRDDMDDWRDPDLKLPFMKTEAELQQRIKQGIVEFIDAEKKRFGDSLVKAHQPQTLSLYEQGAREKEGHYLYRDEHDQPLSAAERENLFSMHILKALASSLDAHTTFYSQSEAYDVKTRLQKLLKGSA